MRAGHFRTPQNEARIHQALSGELARSRFSCDPESGEASSPFASAGRTPAEAHGAGRPVDMMGKAGALPASHGLNSSRAL